MLWLSQKLLIEYVERLYLRSNEIKLEYLIEP